MLRAAPVAAHPQESMLKASALEVFFERLLHVPRQFLSLRRQVRLERGIVFLDELIKESPLGAMAHIRWRTGTCADFPAGGQQQWGRILA